MLTRLQVTGFKNLDKIDVRFGPFTCIAGPNGVGKSNLLDAIAFLSALADKPLIEAAQSVRGGGGRRGDLRSLFRRVGDQVDEEMSFAAEMIIPLTGEDALGQPVEASMTFLRYELKLDYQADPTIKSLGTLRVASESMAHINRSEARARLAFPHTKAWRDSVIRGRRTSPYISTDGEGKDTTVILLHTDSVGGNGGGRPRPIPASSVPRTVLSSVNNATEHRTLVLARQEMMNWTQLQLEPSALRTPASFTAQRSIGPNGANLPATLYELAQAAERERSGGAEDLYARVANRLSELVEDVRQISVDVDEKREIFDIVMTDRSNTEHVASALSDGTLRFLALTVMEADPKSRRLLCLEEPENGMHPSRIPVMLDLLHDLAVDLELPVDDDNPLRQVIINTHSPSVVACIEDHELLVAQSAHSVGGGMDEARLSIRPLQNTWRRGEEPGPTIARGELLAYLNPFAFIERSGALIRRKDMQTTLFPDASSAK